MSQPAPSIDFKQLVRDGVHEDDVATLRRLTTRLGARRKRNTLREAYREGEMRIRNLGIAIPPHLEDIETVVGWPTKAVQDPSRRLKLDGFVTPGEGSANAELAAIFAANNMDLESRQLHDDTFGLGTAFAAVHLGDTSVGEPEVLISGYSALDATGEWNGRTRRLGAGLTVDVRTPAGRAQEMSVWLTDGVLKLIRASDGRWVWDWYQHSLGRPPMVAFAHQQRLNRRFGSSRISRAVMSLTDNAVRTLLRMEVNAEFFSAPQRYVLGADESAFTDDDGNPIPAWQALIGRVLMLEGQPRDDDDPESPRDVPTVGQFQQGSTLPHADQLKVLAMMFSGETGIPVGRLGIIQDNPSSADAIRQGDAESIAIAETATDEFGFPWADVATLTIMVRDGLSAPPRSLAGLRPKWRDVATPTKDSQAQRAGSLVDRGILHPESEITYEQVGFDQVTISRLKAENRQRNARQTLAQLVAAGPVTPEAAALAAGSGPLSPEDVKQRTEALGALVRAGATPESAAKVVGLTGLEFTGGVPVTLRMPEPQAAQLEER
ncbi:phage portal protein [Oerskovia jenensis]|uniref:phage portal protein n=1 Tax=Oerskovia jenensis TaxID=162169 RepID=UPI0036DC65BF